MTRSFLPLAVAAAVSAGLLLTACGGGGSDGSDQIQPSATGATTSAAPTTTAPTQTAGPAAPTFDLPSITTDFAGFDSTDPQKKAVLADAKYAATAILEFEAKTHTKETPNFRRFWTGAEGAKYADTIITEGKDGNVITGAYRYYAPVVKTLQGGNVSVQYYEDQRKGYLMDPRTGKVFVTTPSLKDFRLWNLAMAKGPSGDWQVYDYKWTKGAKSCQVA